MIIGLTGKNAAGKGECAKHLQNKGFSYFSLSDELRHEATKRGMPPTRDALIVLGNALRSEFGPGYLASTINKKIAEMKKGGKSRFVVDSIRSTGEVEELMKDREFVLIGIDAKPELRFERMQKRGRTGDADTFEQFLAQEQKENGKDAKGQQLDACLRMAKIHISNNGTIAELHHAADKTIEELS